MSKCKIVIAGTIIILFLSACSLTKRAGYHHSTDSEIPGGDNLEEKTLAKNISGKDFIISRIKIKYTANNQQRNVSGFLKHKKNGQMLISLRSVAGIEVARVLLSKDSLKVYDKINYILYVQDINYLVSKYGIEKEALPLLWGDLPEIFEEKIEIVDQGGDLVGKINEDNLSYTLLVDKKIGKIKEVLIRQNKRRDLLIKHHEFNDKGGIVYPTYTTAADNAGKFNIEIQFSGIRFEKIKNMRFNTMNVAETKVLR